MLGGECATDTGAGGAAVSTSGVSAAAASGGQGTFTASVSVAGQDERSSARGVSDLGLAVLRPQI